MTGENGQKKLEPWLERIGPSEAIRRFISKYGNRNTSSLYASELCLYFEWLKYRGVKMSPDELIQNNLQCVYGSSPLEVSIKRKHMDFLNDYVNVYLMEHDYSESKRHLAMNAVRQFYKRNDSPLFGDYQVASQPIEAPAKPLRSRDICKVLATVGLRARVPLLISWQTGIEINRVLNMTIGADHEAPGKIELYGRKRHKRAYWTYLGTDSLEQLKLLGARGFPRYHTVREQFRGAAERLGRKGMLENPDLTSWHPHALRHSFATECSAAGVKPEVREFFMGHVHGISWIYQHPELHEDDIRKEYAKVEPFVSLDPDEASIRNEYEERECA